MLLHQLGQPSLAEIRANLISEQLRNIAAKSSYINVFVTGRSASGKTTLGNRLVGEDYFLSTGRQNTTQVVNLIEFPGGIRFFDLPGVDGGGRQEGGRLENYNRASLGLSQFSSYPNITDITVATYRQNNVPKEYTYTLDQFEQLPFKPDLVFYLIDPKKGLSRSEEDYTTNLIQSGHKVIYVLNVWVDKDNKPLATKQNFQDTEKTIKEIYIELQRQEEPVIVQINCQTGQGIDELLEQASLSLADARGLVFKQVVLAQHEKAPQQYIDSIKQELIKIFVDIACYKPNSVDDAKEKLENTSRLLWDYLISFSLHKKYSSHSNLEELTNYYSDFKKDIKPLIKTIINSVKIDCYLPVTVPLPFVQIVYRKVQLYETIWETVDDFEQPIYEKQKFYVDEGLKNFLETGRREKLHVKDVFTGRFKKKQVMRRVPSGTKKEFSNIDIWTEPIGLKKYSYTIYNFFGIYGISFLKALSLAIINSNFQNKSQFRKYTYSYYSFLNELTNLNFLYQNQEPEKSQLNNVLANNINFLLDEKFDLSAITTFVEIKNSKNTRKSWLEIFLSINENFIIRMLFELHNLRALAIKITFASLEIFSIFGVQCLKLVFYYGKFIFDFFWEIYKSLRERF